MERITLSRLKPGQEAMVLENRCAPALNARLEDLGLTRGLMVTCLHRAPSGTPAAYSIRGASIALRREDAELILVGRMES